MLPGKNQSIRERNLAAGIRNQTDIMNSHRLNEKSPTSGNYVKDGGIDILWGCRREGFQCYFHSGLGKKLNPQNTLLRGKTQPVETHWLQGFPKDMRQSSLKAWILPTRILAIMSEVIYVNSKHRLDVRNVTIFIIVLIVMVHVMLMVI